MTLDLEEATSCVEKLEENGFVITSSINYQNDWIVDSRCLNHMIGDMDKLQSMTEDKGY